MTKFGHRGHFGPNIGIFGPFGIVPNQKTLRTRCLGGFPVTWVPKVLLPLFLRSVITLIFVSHTDMIFEKSKLFLRLVISLIFVSHTDKIFEKSFALILWMKPFSDGPIGTLLHRFIAPFAIMRWSILDKKRSFSLWDT